MLDSGFDFDPSWVLYEDEDVIVVDKPAGVPCQAPDDARDDDLLARLRRFLAKRDGVEEGAIYLGVHQRLDSETSGAILYTRRESANGSIAQQFKSRAVRKTYVAGVYGYRGGGQTLRDTIGKGRDGAMRVVPASSAKKGAKGKLAVTHVRPAERQGERSLVELGCETGRTHQLRVQLAHHGFPIAGDVRYGNASAPRMLLHARELQLTLPSGRALEVSAPLPTAFSLWLTQGMPEGLTPALLQASLPTAVQRRMALLREAARTASTTTFRLVHREADGVPGVAVDVYDRYLVVNLFDEGLPEEAAVVEALAGLGFEGVYLKRHPKQKNELVDARGTELCPSMPVVGNAAPEELVVFEYGVPFGVRLGDGLRTGLFLDQRRNRRRVARLAGGKRVLNLFAYTGGFSTAALASGAAAALCVDASAAALQRAKENTARIGAADRHRTWAGDVFEVLPRLARRAEQFDVIVLDPPSYATTKRRRFRAAKDYPELVALCLAVLAPGGHLLSCLNHHQVSQGKLRAMVSAGAERAGRTMVSHRDLATGSDFPQLPGQEPLFKSVLTQFE